MMREANEVLWEKSASQLAAGYRRGHFSPVEVMDAILDRIDQVNPRINAVVTLDRDRARAAAHDSEGRFCKGSPISPIDGVPITVKDSVFVAGLKATWGSRL